jgi:protein involved in polysaccharide export with SLBB domain
LLWGHVLVAGDAPVPDISGAGLSQETPSSPAARKLVEMLQAQTPQPSSEQREPNLAQKKVEQVKAEKGASAIELLLSGKSVDIASVQLNQFGYDVFRGAVSTFAPVTDVPVGPDYIVGPGDSFTITLWGRVNAQYSVTITTTGEIILPELGLLKVAGMTFAKLEDYLNHEFSRKHTDFKLAITMGRLRTIRVYVVGEAASPGSYTISSLSTAINAIFAAGGPSKNGTLRNIRLSRSQQEPMKLDLYDFLLGGDKSKDARLQDGDTIFIPLIGPVVGIAGNVKRPAIYEIAEPMTLSEVLDLAGGVTYAGWLQRVQVERVENHQRRIVADFNISGDGVDPDSQEAAKIPIKDGDVVKVFSVMGSEQNVVYLEGHVIRPGKYEFKQGMKLKEILSSYDVFQPQPNLDYGEVERLIEPDLHPVVITFNVGKVLMGDEPANLELNRFDRIRIFRWDERIKRTVSISGLIFKPSDYRLVPEMRVSDLVDVAGGLMKSAYLKTAELTRRHISQSGMETEKIDIDLEKAMAGDYEHNILLEDYDHLIVRPIPGVELDRVATVSGEVKFPGTYPIQKGEVLSSLIERAGGFTERAYLKGTIFTRESARVVQQDRMDRLIRQLEETMLTESERTISGTVSEAADVAKEQQQVVETKKQLLAKLRAARIDGRVVVKLLPLEQFRTSKYDLELERGDALVVPEIPGVVTVVGEVFNPTSLLYEKGRAVRYYLGKVGGLTKEADNKELCVIRADGSVVSMAQRSGDSVSWDDETHRWSFGGFLNMTLVPGDTIVVPRKMDKALWLRTTKDITQILFQMALTAGVVLAL